MTPALCTTSCQYQQSPRKAWQNLWKCDPLYLEPRHIIKPNLEDMQALGIPRLGQLPIEIIMIIQSYSSHSILWRLYTTLSIAKQASNENGSPQDLKKFPIGEVSAWERGKEPILANNSPQDPIIRLTLDAYGIKEVERLPNYSDTMGDQVDCGSTAFAFIDERFIDQQVESNDQLQMSDRTEAAKISNAVFHFQFGRARLHFEPLLHGPWVWNTPSPAIQNISIASQDGNYTTVVYRTTDIMPLDPPPTTNSLLQFFGNSYQRAYEPNSTPHCSTGHRLHVFPYMRDRTSWRYYNTSLDQTTGLTFFFKSSRFYGVHSHTAKMPSAVDFLERLPYPVRSRLSWVYVPLPPNDDIVAMGVRGGRRRVIMIRKRLSGEIFVGSLLGPQPPQYGLLESPPLAFVFNQIPVRHVNGFGVVVRNDSSSDNFIQVPPPQLRTSPPPEVAEETLHSVAPLEGLVRVSIFQARIPGFCVGLLMEYRDGAQRTLGSCRLGLDLVTTCSEPTHICVLSTILTGRGIHYPTARVEVTNEGEPHNHHPEGWICRPLSQGGSVEVWFSYKVFQISFLDPPA
ncbi:hypothetical protein LCI18_010154 [Fusarium solani-melongenae]|uniref:Uncharacterized protein n=1 Tax=Fusarium solani subsp. cucurbitae TaxID=2747967 RepID=A0ACD3ZD04_FUSSC|nr:hypothetical protein LCI18_010154 [Fusarium solani-melongenae]